MTVFEKIKTMNIDEFAEWFNEHCAHDTDPCISWWDKNYCNKCEAVIATIEGYHNDVEFAWCELHDKCKYFKDLDKTPDTLQMTKLWLESEVKDE